MKQKKAMQRGNILMACAIWAMAMCFTACVNDDSDLMSVTEEYSIKPVQVQFDESWLDEDDDSVITDATIDGYKDFVENTNFSREVYITFADDTAYVTNEIEDVTVTTNKAHVTVNIDRKRVALIVSGSTGDGSLKVYSEKKFKLLLNGVTITNPKGAAINNQCHKRLFVVLADGTTSTLTDGAVYDMVDGEDQKATLFSEGQIIFSGTGTLNVHAQGKSGISTDDYIIFRPGSRFFVSSISGNGIRAKDGITINGSAINVQTTAAGKSAIRSKSFITINGGRTIGITTGDASISEETTYDTAGNAIVTVDTTTCAGIKCDSLLTITAGTVKLKSEGDGGKGVRAKYGITMTGGALYGVGLGYKLSGKPKGIKVDGTVAVSGGYFYGYSKRSKPFDADSLIVAPGYTRYDENNTVITISY